MHILYRFIKSKEGQIISDLALASLWLYFAFKHLYAFQYTGNHYILLFTFSETLLVLMFLIRDRTLAVSNSAVGWVAGILGSFTPLLFSPNDLSPNEWSGILILVGVCIQILGLASLNRSFGIVPAERKIRTNGLYRFIRHPMYASYLFTFTGYVIGNISTPNIMIAAISLLLMVIRIHEEEKILSSNATYLEYSHKVKWRLIPFLY